MPISLWLLFFLGSNLFALMIGQVSMQEETLKLMLLNGLIAVAVFIKYLL